MLNVGPSSPYCSGCDESEKGVDIGVRRNGGITHARSLPCYFVNKVLRERYTGEMFEPAFHVQHY